jgi:hypothetical protein
MKNWRGTWRRVHQCTTPRRGHHSLTGSVRSRRHRLPWDHDTANQKTSFFPSIGGRGGGTVMSRSSRSPRSRAMAITGLVLNEPSAFRPRRRKGRTNVVVAVGTGIGATTRGGNRRGVPVFKLHDVDEGTVSESRLVMEDHLLRVARCVLVRLQHEENLFYRDEVWVYAPRHHRHATEIHFGLSGSRWSHVGACWRKKLTRRRDAPDMRRNSPDSQGNTIEQLLSTGHQLAAPPLENEREGGPRRRAIMEHPQHIINVGEDDNEVL